FPQCALVVIGHPDETRELAERWLAERADLVVMRVDVVGDAVQMAMRAPRLDPLLTALRELVERVAASDSEGGGRSLLDAAVAWVPALVGDAVERVPDDNGDLHGLSVTRATLLQSLDAPFAREADQRLWDLVDAEATLDRALATAHPAEPLAAAA